MKMISLIRNMMIIRQKKRFNHIDQLLYFELLAICFCKYKGKQFQCPNDELTKTLGVDRKTVSKARKKLCDAKLISYESGNGKGNFGQYNFIESPSFTPSFDNPPTESLDDNTLPQKSRKGTAIPPSVEEVEAYCLERKNGIEEQYFIDFYTAKGWMIGKNKMKDWKAAIRTWEKTKKQNENKSDNSRPKDYGKLF